MKLFSAGINIILLYKRIFSYIRLNMMDEGFDNNSIEAEDVDMQSLENSSNSMAL